MRSPQASKNLASPPILHKSTTDSASTYVGLVHSIDNAPTAVRGVFTLGHSGYYCEATVSQAETSQGLFHNCAILNRHEIGEIVS